jgi:hypothetical protein
MLKRLLLAAVLVVVGVWAVPGADRAQAQPQPRPQGCELLNDPAWDGISLGGGVAAPNSVVHFNAGETLVVTAKPAPVSPPATEFMLTGFTLTDGSIGGLDFHIKATIPNTSTYHFTNGGELTFVNWSANGYADWDISCVKGGVGALGDCASPLTETSVVGAFVQDALVYAEPGVSSAPAIILPAGKTAWVLGVDASGQYYKIRWACQYLWVEVSTLGPNFDDVWNGHPLPTTVVE